MSKQKINRVAVSRIISVFDGDTFRCDVDTWPKLFGYHIPIRIARIDCPERRSLSGKEKALAMEARLFTDTTLRNAKRIVLENVTRGKYFRLIADVKVDGRDLASDLLDNGLAVVRRNSKSLLGVL